MPRTRNSPWPSATRRLALPGNKAKLPQVGNELKASDIAIVRGLSDSFALRLANHTDKVHTHYRPQGKNARAVFEAVEQARIEALGANAMPGMENNLAAMLDDRYRRKDVARYTDRKDAPLEEAVALMVREKLTGEPPPEGARTMVDLWRPWIEEKAEAQLAHLMDSIHDQAAFARMSRDIIAALDMADELGEDPDQSDENDENSEPEEDSGERQETPEGEEQESPSSPWRRCRTPRAKPKPPKWTPSRWTSTSSRTTWRARKRPMARSRGGRSFPSRRSPTRISTRSSPTSSTRRSPPRTCATPRS